MKIRILARRRGSVTVLAAAIFPVLIGMAGLATEYGDALLTQMKAQRIADAAAWSGALAYNQSGSSASIANAANRIATVNGISTQAMTASLVSSPTGDSNNAVKATVSINVPLDLAHVINKSSTQVGVTATSYAELKTSAGGIPCVIALSSVGSGVTMSGAGKITANSCAVTSNASLAVPNGTNITTPLVTYGGSAPSSTTLSNLSAPAGYTTVTVLHKTISDPLAGNTAVTSMVSHLGSVELLGNPSAPTTPSGTSPSFGYKAAGTYAIGPCSGTTGAYNGVWVVTCSGAGPFNFGSLSISAASVTFNNTTPATYNFSGSINTGSANVTFNGAGTYNIAGGLTVGGGSTTAFNGAGTFNIGPNSSCSGSNYSICNGGTSLTFAGPSTFVLSNGIYDSGGETLILGSGSAANSYQIGESSTKWAINMGGGSVVTLNDAIGTTFQAAGNISNGGGSCLTLPAASAHDINGNIILGGGATLGSGVYTIAGYLSLGSGGGGAVTCGGKSIGLYGANVSIVLGGTSTVSCGSTVSFCATGGYSNVTLTAPSSGPTANIAVIGPPSSSTNSTAGAVLTAGATGASITGAFYFPNGPFTMGGGASLGSGGCLEVIATQVSVTAGTALASACTGLAGSSLLPGTIALVQ